MILEITQLIWLQTPKGQGIAKFLIDYGPESDLYWVCFIHETGEVWTFSNEEVRATNNISLGRRPEEPPLWKTDPAAYDAMFNKS